MHELVVAVSDLYLSQETPERQLPAGVALPGLQHVTRFGRRGRLAAGWRPWVADWLTAGRPASRHGAGARSVGVASASACTSAAPASVAAWALPTKPPAPMVWMATPVHLVAGLSTVHLDRRSLLRLDPEDLSALSEEFRRVFHDSGFDLEPLASGEFLLFGPQIASAGELEPARFLGENVAEVQGARTRDPQLRRLSAEIEMWLYEHPVNDARRQRGEVPITGLWLWGGGVTQSESDRKPLSDIAFGRDAYLQGLWRSSGEKVLPLPRQLADVLGYPHAQRAVLVIEIGSMLHSAPTWTFFDALEQIDRAFINPAVQALHSAELQRLVLLANDRELTLSPRDRFKLWRRAPPGLLGLQ